MQTLHIVFHVHTLATQNCSIYRCFTGLQRFMASAMLPSCSALVSISPSLSWLYTTYFSEDISYSYENIPTHNCHMGDLNQREANHFIGKLFLQNSEDFDDTKQ